MKIIFIGAFKPVREITRKIDLDRINEYAMEPQDYSKNM